MTDAIARLEPAGQHRVGTDPARGGPFSQALKRSGSVLWTAIALVSVVVGSLALVLAIATHVWGNGQQYTVFGHPVMTVVSGSMTPTIRTGDLVYDDRLSPTAAAHLHVGQIISFRSAPGSAQIITHRIDAAVSVDGHPEYRTKGDANASPDAALVQPRQIVGLYQGTVPYGGYLLHALHQPLSLALLLAAPLLWLVSGWFFGLARETEGADHRE